MVEAATARLAKGWSEQLRLVQIEIREVPERQLAEDLEISLGSHMAGTAATPARVTLYRRPITLRAPEVRERRDLVRDVLAEQLGHIWSMSARDIDPSYAGPDIY